MKNKSREQIAIALFTGAIISLSILVWNLAELFFLGGDSSDFIRDYSYPVEGNLRPISRFASGRRCGKENFEN